MSKLDGLLGGVSLFLKRNSSTILTCVGAAGVIFTAVAAAKATPKAVSLVKEKEESKGGKLTVLEKVQTAGPVYIPSILIGASTIACIFGANVLNKRTQAALTSAYALLDSSYKEYKDKIEEIFGEDAKRIVTAKIAENHCEDVEQPKGDERIFYDFFSLRCFDATMEQVFEAEQYMNDTLQSRGYVGLSEFYDRLGISNNDPDYTLGWSTAAGRIYDYDRIIFEHEKVTMANGSEVWVITLPIEPTPDYYLL